MWKARQAAERSAWGRASREGEPERAPHASMLLRSNNITVTPLP